MQRLEAISAVSEWTRGVIPKDSFLQLAECHCIALPLPDPILSS